jgi:hypothetical protein
VACELDPDVDCQSSRVTQLEHRFLRRVRKMFGLLAI